MDVVQRLQTELASRCEKNSKYSLRAFARQLDVSPTLLSLVMNGHRAPSAALEARVNDRLGENLSLDRFRAINSRLAYAILSLTKTFDFKRDAAWIALRLGSTVHEVRAKLSALESSGLLKNWKQATAPIRMNNRLSTADTRAFQREMIEHALESLENDPIDLRDVGSITFSIDARDLDAIREEIRAFRRKLATKYEKKTRLTDVYTLTIQFTPHTKAKP